MTLPVIPGRLTWFISHTLKEAHIKKRGEEYLNDFGPEAKNKFYEEVKDLMLHQEGTIKDLLEATNQDEIALLPLEEKFFETWNYGRLATIGDGKFFCLFDRLTHFFVIYIGITNQINLLTYI
jgi:hypothetical protein